MGGTRVGPQTSRANLFPARRVMPCQRYRQLPLAQAGACLSPCRHHPRSPITA